MKPESTAALRPLTGLELGRDIDLLARPDVLQRRAVRSVIAQLQAFVDEATASRGHRTTAQVEGKRRGPAMRLTS